MYVALRVGGFRITGRTGKKHKLGYTYPPLQEPCLGFVFQASISVFDFWVCKPKLSTYGWGLLQELQCPFQVTVNERVAGALGLGNCVCVCVCRGKYSRRLKNITIQMPSR